MAQSPGAKKLYDFQVIVPENYFNTGPDQFNGNRFYTEFYRLLQILSLIRNIVIYRRI